MPDHSSIGSSIRALSLPRKILIMGILTLVTCAVSLAPRWVLLDDGRLNEAALGVRVITSLIMAAAMLGIERRRQAASPWDVIADGLLIAVIIVVAGNIGASDAYTAQLPTRTVATLIGTPLLLLLTHLLVRKAAS